MPNRMCPGSDTKINNNKRGLKGPSNGYKFIIRNQQNQYKNKHFVKDEPGHILFGIN
jgi:hypothetical protein